MQKKEKDLARMDSTSESQQHIDAGSNEAVPPTVSDNRVSNLLAQAGDLIERDGWCQELYYRGNQSCAIGALIRLDPIRRFAAMQYMTRAIGESCVAQWNDRPERTAEEVIAKLREAAQLARESSGTAV